MKFYYTPVACSMAGHIALIEVGRTFDSERVDLKTGRTASGRDFRQVNAKGYVPALELNDGTLVTENIAVFDYLGTLFPVPGPDGPLDRTRLLEMLAYVSTEIHKSFKPYWHGGSETERRRAGAYIRKRLDYLDERLDAPFLFGSAPTVADYYLFVTLYWAQLFSIALPPRLTDLRARLRMQPAVREMLVRDLLGERIRRSGVQLKVSLAEELADVGMDTISLQQVLINLLSNGIEAIETESGGRRLDLRARLAGDWLQIEIADQGPGLENPDAVFEPFFTTKPEGMGMGLATCKSIVEAHGGRIRAEHTIPTGARFVVHLPVDQKADE